MSDCGGILVTCLTAPLLLVVLLLAGVSYLAIKTAGLVGDLALEGIQFAGQTLASGVRAASAAVEAAQRSATATASEAARRVSTLQGSAQMAEQLRASAQAQFRTALAELESHAALTVRSTQARSLTSETTAEQPVRVASQAKTDAASEHHGSVQAATASVARARAIERALSAQKPLTLMADTMHATELVAARATLSAAQAALTAGETRRASELATKAESVFASVTHQAHQQFVKAERATTTAIVGNTLEDLGYEVRVAGVKDNVALVGRREHQTIAMVLRPNGRMEMDMAGFEDDACERDSRALLDGLRRNGLVISQADIRRHGCFEGGVLIQAAQRRGQSLASALAEMTSTETSAPNQDEANDEPVRRRTLLSARSEEHRLRQARGFIWSQNQQRTGGR